LEFFTEIRDFSRKNDTLKQQLEHEATLDVTKQLAEAQRAYEMDIRENNKASAPKKSDYAYCLIASPRAQDRQTGLTLLKELHGEDPGNRDYLYYIALGNYKLQDFVEARKYADMLLSIEPQNTQALDIKSLAQEKVAQEGLVGMAILGGAAIAIASGLVFLLRKK